MKYSLGPVLYYWPKETLEDFYQQAANCSADTIYLGEAVCSKRRATKVGDWIEMAKTLAASGKQVVLSTLALVQASSELGELKRYVDNGEFLIEASDLGVVNLCAERKLPFVAGHPYKSGFRKENRPEQSSRCDSRWERKRRRDRSVRCAKHPGWLRDFSLFPASR